MRRAAKSGQQSNLNRRFPIIMACRVEVAGVDAVRILGLAGCGHKICLRFPTRKDASEVGVAVLGRKYFGPVEVRDAGSGQSELSRSVRMEVYVSKKRNGGSYPKRHIGWD